MSGNGIRAAGQQMSSFPVMVRIQPSPRQGKSDPTSSPMSGRCPRLFTLARHLTPYTLGTVHPFPSLVGGGEKCLACHEKTANYPTNPFSPMTCLNSPQKPAVAGPLAHLPPHGPRDALTGRHPGYLRRPAPPSRPAPTGPAVGPIPPALRPVPHRSAGPPGPDPGNPPVPWA